METDPVNMVPMATKRPSSRTANADKLSLMATELDKAPFSGFHSCR